MKRIYHTWDEWECYPAGFYETKPPGRMTDKEAVAAYRDFLSDLRRFGAALSRVLREWPNSCEHYLTNENMNRIAWLGQAAACIELGLPRAFRSGFHSLDDRQKADANTLALVALNVWLIPRGEGPLSDQQAQSKTEMDLY